MQMALLLPTRWGVAASFEQIAPTEPWEAGEAAIGGPPLAPVFEGQRRQVGIGRGGASDVSCQHQISEDRPMAAPRLDELGLRLCP